MTQPKICPRCGEAYDATVDFCAKDGTRLVRGGQTGDLIGTVIAERYRIVSRIGEGGMGQVYLAEHVRMKRKSAIKIMRPALVHEVESLQRFTREAENASQLSHPNIAAIFDFGETDDGVVYLAMEYIDGESLATKLQMSALHPDVAADILGQAADALQAAHDMNMLHRDIKPDNIMLGKRNDGTYMVKLVDFGIARTMDGSDQKVTRTGFAVGTPQFMSPEQLAGDALDARSDQYSLALVAFVALTGKQAFPAESSKESLIARLTSRPQTLQNAKQDVEWPDALQEIFDRALAPEPNDRFDTVSEFAHALSGAISSMTPTQTAELYRRALDVRVASVAARTPHSDLEGLRTPSGSLATLGTPSTGREIVSRSGSISTVGTPTGAPQLTPGGTAATPPKPPARWPFIIGGVVTVSVAATLYFVSRGKPGDALEKSLDASTLKDSAPAVAVASAPSTATPTAAAAPPASNGSAPAPASAGQSAPTASSKPAPGAPLTAGSALRARAAATAESIKQAQADSAKKDAARKAKRVADSVAAVANVRARYPEAAARAMVERGIDVKAHTTKSNDVRATIMPTPMFVWRSEQARAFKDAHPKPGGGSYDAVDPIEKWGAWPSLVSSRRAVYVLDVVADRTPWPSYEPEKLFDLKKGDVTAVELLRDGSPVTLDNSAQIPAVVNGPAHVSAGKPVSNGFVATIAPTAFIPRDDGKLPKMELLIHDASRGGAVTRITLSESLVRRLYDEFAPWRDALAKP